MCTVYSVHCTLYDIDCQDTRVAGKPDRSGIFMQLNFQTHLVNFVLGKFIFIGSCLKLFFSLETKTFLRKINFAKKLLIIYCSIL